MKALIEQLLAVSPIITDGAWGTQLQALGLPIGECPDAWNINNPSCVEDVARSYVEAGSRIILTNTFSANRITLTRYNLADRANEISRTGAAISRHAAGDRAYVFASMGPTGKMLAMSEVSEQEVHAAFQEQAHALAEGGADALVIETMSDLKEAEIALAAARETGLPVVVSMVYGAGQAGDRTIMGVTPEQAVETLTAAGADVIGSNCGEGPAGFVTICKRMRAVTDLPIWVKPNAGRPELVAGSADFIYRTTPEGFAAYAPALIEGGANFIGGCCGTSPAFVRALSAAIKGA